jgi:hypothetical protein
MGNAVAVSVWAAGCSSGSSPLLITQASQGQAEFATDRGLRELPAWRLGGPEIDLWARATIGCARTVITRLTRPLGERVVIDLDASPVMVLAQDPA